MEIAFYSNKCALKDTLRIIRHAKNPCLKRKQQLTEYSEGLIGTNQSIISLHPNISQDEVSEFTKLVDQWHSLNSTATTGNNYCLVCLKNCLESHTESLPSQSTTIEEPQLPPKTQDIKDVADKMERLHEKAQFIEAVVTVQNERIDQTSYDTQFSAEYSQNHLVELEEILRRKKRSLLIKRWLGALFVFICFLSLLLLRPVFP
ncbi:hypothetical protein NEHOM01_2101 [Nematocida homosporus]|uniref:uncharacterized protein n=1 Tax=Nematocida homosporus TaxID=1912981 RepID=UPI00221FF8BB|nr:uncharacterized protein NEHOM01_2101 [Nematocida homosporus]KAI5187334.1 hypothetical protein NEHOM01_2101 [Nematocida homosporus]